MLCVLILYISSGTYVVSERLIFWETFSWQVYLFRVFVRNLLRGNHRKNTFCILFWCLAWGSNPGFAFNKPTHYLLDHGDFAKNGDGRWTAIFRTKFSSELKHISHSVGMLLNKIVVFGVIEVIEVIGVIEERSSHPENVTVWCGLWTEGVIDWDTVLYVAKSIRKLPQKNQCLQNFALRSFKWCSVSHIMSTFRFYNKKET